MKTKKVRPVLVESKEHSNIIYVAEIEKLMQRSKITNSSELLNNLGFDKQLILISLDSNEKIEDDYTKPFVFMYPSGQAWICQHNGVGKSDYKSFGYKIIATQDQIPSEYIQQFIEEYNNGEVKDIDIKMELFWKNKGKNRVQPFPDATATEKDRVYKPKLTNGFVTIVDNNKELERGITITKVKELVDFEKMFHVIDELACIDDFYPTSIDELDIKNLQLFFQKLSESSSFAHKAHKELRKLSK